MLSLDHKIPPPIVAFASAVLAWAISQLTPALDLDGHFKNAFAAFFVLLGVALVLWALVAFRAARTTVNPLAPSRSNVVVRIGPYRFTRNPMYLGMALLLVAWCIFLGNALALVSVILFNMYITKFQIAPEERALLAKFGVPYAAYLADVRRWL
jgi:protein-S-isoprenylcysteine O-methyltransferase Ste14